MSGSHGHDHGHDPVEDDHDDDHHDVGSLPDEPESPAWLPLLGGGLLLMALLAFLVTRSPDAEPEDAAPAAAESAAAAEPAAAEPAAAAPDADPHAGHDH